MNKPEEKPISPRDQGRRLASDMILGSQFGRRNHPVSQAVVRRLRDDEAGRSISAASKFKRLVWPLAMAASVLAAVAVWWMQTGDGERGAGLVVARVTHLNGECRGVVPMTRDPRPASRILKPGDALYAGEQVQTESGAYARLALADGSTVEIDQSSGFGFQVSSGQPHALARGAIYCVVRKRQAGQPPFVIQTPWGARVEVIGTAFEFLVDPTAEAQSAIVRVQEGRVSLSMEGSVPVSAGPLEEVRIDAAKGSAGPIGIRPDRIAPWRPGQPRAVTNQPPAVAGEPAAAQTNAPPLFRDDFQDGLFRWTKMTPGIRSRLNIPDIRSTGGLMESPGKDGQTARYVWVSRPSGFEYPVFVRMKTPVGLMPGQGLAVEWDMSCEAAAPEASAGTIATFMMVLTEGGQARFYNGPDSAKEPTGENPSYFAVGPLPIPTSTGWIRYRAEFQFKQGAEAKVLPEGMVRREGDRYVQTVRVESRTLLRQACWGIALMDPTDVKLYVDNVSIAVIPPDLPVSP